MSLKLERTPLDGLCVLEPREFADERGFFLESHNQRKLTEAGIDVRFVQDNHSRSTRGVLRGLHYQRYQGKLVSVIHGEIFDVAVDIRPDSPTFGHWFGSHLDDRTHRQLWVPAGFAHGFSVLSDTFFMVSATTEFYTKELEGGIIWNDPAIGIEWPVARPVLSERDQELPRLEDIPRDSLLTCAEL